MQDSTTGAPNHGIGLANQSRGQDKCLRRLLHVHSPESQAIDGSRRLRPCDDWIDAVQASELLREETLTESALRTTEVAKLLNVNIEAAYTLIRNDGLPAARVGGRGRFSKSKVLSWFEARHMRGLDEQRRATDTTDQAQ